MTAFDIENSVGFLLAKAHQRLYAHFRKELEPFGITPPQFALLAFLWKRDRISQTELSARTEVDRTTLGGLVDRLAKMGLVRREANPEDRRSYLVCLTSAGKALEADLTGIALGVRKRIVANLGAGEYETLCTLLEKLRA
ncbi:MarR family transcriptional regulator [Desulfuromonas versatilis]|uniref:MarR family transcriptional regulator n=1 Tax=Desulfuromonas versatilis TaxID=2802975 RepID=A0ABN6DW62_9BACT|nr:MarR family transcriptional regulator [Desulfuromonas versatilis]BCR04305.1 MarR family transcriptional regulator [Desulfuromonas versatilis]